GRRFVLPRCADVLQLAAIARGDDVQGVGTEQAAVEFMVMTEGHELSLVRVEQVEPCVAGATDRGEQVDFGRNEGLIPLPYQGEEGFGKYLGRHASDHQQY